MKRYKSKVERRYGDNLGIKGDRGNSSKAAFRRKPYPPGHRGKGGFRRISPFGQQLAEKQKLRIAYGLKEKQFKAYYDKAHASDEPTGTALVRFLEGRLDNVIFKLGFAETRAQARQLVSHGHFYINGKKTTIPSYAVRVKDEITLAPRATNREYWRKMPERIAKVSTPSWLALDKKTLSAKIVSEPLEDDLKVAVNMNMVVEYYSR